MENHAPANAGHGRDLRMNDCDQGADRSTNCFTTPLSANTSAMTALSFAQSDHTSEVDVFF